MSKSDSLRGRKVAVLGRLTAVPRTRLERMLRAAGAHLTRSLISADCIVLSHASSAKVLSGEGLSLPSSAAEDGELLSERDLRLALGIEAEDSEPGTMTALELARRAGIAPALIVPLRAFDVIRDVRGLFGFRALVALRQVRDLLDAGVDLQVIVAASSALWRQGLTLSQARLTEAPWGVVVRRTDGGLATLDGQMDLLADVSHRSVSDLLDGAEDAEDAGDYVAAERLLWTAMRADPADASIPFSLGNLACRRGAVAEARALWTRCAAVDPAFAETWFNLACTSQEFGNHAQAIAEYGRAIQAAPDYSDAIFNLALLFTKLERYADAMPLWERYRALGASEACDEVSRKALLLCRMALRQESASA